MKDSRLTDLYLRRLVTADTAGKLFPTAFTLQRDVRFFPDKPADLNFDILEIGPGRGDFLFHLAAENPDKKVLAIERGKLRFAKLTERLQRLGLKNVTLVEGDARIPLVKDLQNSILKKIYVLFPDPWPRNRHRHKRLLTRDFVNSLCEKLPPGGEFTLATDVEDYARWVMSHFEKIPFMTDVQGRDTTLAPLPDLIPTFFETKWRDLGRVCHYVRFRRV